MSEAYERTLDLVLDKLKENSGEYFALESEPSFTLLERKQKRLSEILRYQISANGGEKRNIYIKIQKNPDHDRERIEEFCKSEYETLELLYHRLDGYPRFSVIKPIACFLEHLVTITEEAKGENLFNLLKTNGRLGTKKPGFQQLKDYCYSCGEWLGAFQSVTDQNQTQKLAELGLPEQISESFARWEKSGIGETSMDTIIRYTEQQLKQYGDTEIPICGQHGDFMPFNIIANPDHIVLLDFPYYTAGPIYNDPARFCAVLISMPKNVFYKSENMDILMQSFLSGYSQYNKNFSPGVFELFLIRNMTDWLSWEKSVIGNGLAHKLFSYRVISFYLSWFRRTCNIC